MSDILDEVKNESYEEESLKKDKESWSIYYCFDGHSFVSVRSTFSVV